MQVKFFTSRNTVKLSTHHRQRSERKHWYYSIHSESITILFRVQNCCVEVGGASGGVNAKITTPHGG